jgi:hypothetical protein
MKRQITLVGGQTVPVYLGIQERKPDFVYLIASAESKSNLDRIRQCCDGVEFQEYIVDPYGFQEITDLIEQLVFEHTNDQWELNLTSGTKVMSIAAQNIFRELKDQVEMDSFYIDQKGRLFSLTLREYTQLKSELSIPTFLKLSGHGNIKSSSLNKYTIGDFKFAQQWSDWLDTDSDLDNLYSAIGQECSKIKDFSSNVRIEIRDKGVANWKDQSLTVKTASKSFEKHFDHKNALEMCFTGLWWELLVAQVVNEWELKKEIMVGVELLTNSKQKYAKNEIDIILNTGQNMIFIECKSGNVKQEDVNKMRAVKEMYGGISSRSILVCRKLPRRNILEKCSDLGIDVFALKEEKWYKGKIQGYHTITSLKQLNIKLTNLTKKTQL